MSRVDMKRGMARTEPMAKAKSIDLNADVSSLTLNWMLVSFPGCFSSWVGGWCRVGRGGSVWGMCVGLDISTHASQDLGTYSR